jgi:hypothetical protein
MGDKPQFIKLIGVYGRDTRTESSKNGPASSTSCQEIIAKIKRIPIDGPWTTAIVILGPSTAATDTPDGGTTYDFAFPACGFTESVDTSDSGQIIGKRPY